MSNINEYRVKIKRIKLSKFDKPEKPINEKDMDISEVERKSNFSSPYTSNGPVVNTNTGNSNPIKDIKKIVIKNFKCKLKTKQKQIKNIPHSEKLHKKVRCSRFPNRV